MSDFRSKLSLGFKNLRSKGYFARQSFWCCQSCGTAAVPNNKANAYAFYHQQDLQGFLDNKKGVYLAWAGDPNVIRKAFEDAGCAVVHNGSKTERIWVCAAPTTEEEDYRTQLESLVS